MSYTVTHKGKKLNLPDFQDLPVGVVRKSRNLPEEEQSWFILENLLDDKQLAVIDTMTVHEFAQFMNGWTQGASLGEYSQSAKS